MEEDAGPSRVPRVARALVHELFELSIAMDLIGHAAAGRLGINQTDLVCLDLLVRRGPMSAGEVAAALGLTTAAISAMAARLEAGGYARREMDPKDRRRVLLHAAPADARRALSLFDGFYAGATELCSTVDGPELDLLIDLLGRFRQLSTDHAARLRALRR